MQHHFEIHVAQEYGVNVAIFLNNIAFWLQKNIANRVNFHKERFWTFNTQPAFLELFSYWSLQNLRTTIKNCLKNDLIKIDNFNEKKYDKTNWYCLTDKGLTLFNGLKDAHEKAVLEKNSNKNIICEDQHIHKLDLTYPSVRSNRPIPDNKQDIKQDIKHTKIHKKETLSKNNTVPQDKSSSTNNIKRKEPVKNYYKPNNSTTYFPRNTVSEDFKNYEKKINTGATGDAYIEAMKLRPKHMRPAQYRNID